MGNALNEHIHSLKILARDLFKIAVIQKLKSK